jgi:DNA-binding winged helix-turn-helix (wHTH) protein
VTYCFDEFALDSGTRQLRRSGAEAHLSPKAFDLLLLLVANNSRAMSKADLHQHLWPSTYVSDTSLAGLVAEIRQALGDPADSPRYIRTVHRFGYWFIGAVEAPPGRPDSDPPAVRYWLLCESRQIALTEGEHIVGRAPDAAVWIDAPGVSRHHARLRLEGPRATVEDLGSKNGTYLGGTRVDSPSPLSDGDQIRLGTVVMTFRIPPPAETTETVRSKT